MKIQEKGGVDSGRLGEREEARERAERSGEPRAESQTVSVSGRARERGANGAAAFCGGVRWIEFSSGGVTNAHDVLGEGLEWLI